MSEAKRQDKHDDTYLCLINEQVVSSVFIIAQSSRHRNSKHDPDLMKNDV